MGTPLAVAWKVALGFGAAAVILALSREAVGGGPAPPVLLLLAWAAAVAACTGAALVAVVRWDLALPWAVVGYALAYNGFVIAAKFVLAPHSLYLANRLRPLTGLLSVAEELGVIAAAGFVFLLYAGVYALVFRIVRRRAGLPGLWGDRGGRLSARWLVTIVIVAVLLLAGATGGGAVLIAALLAGAGLEYVEFVFGTGVSVLVALTLGGAIWLVARMFGSAAERAQAVGDATVLASVFWVGLAFLALYHALWVVYMLILVTLWPLRTVVPK